MRKLYISMYHYTRDLKHSRYPEIRGLDTELFEQQLDYFEKNFNVVRMEDVINAVQGGGGAYQRTHFFLLSTMGI